MIPARLRQCLKILRWKPIDLAEQLGCRESEVTIWLDGRVAAPIVVAAWLEALVKAHRDLPPPSLSKPESTPVDGPIKLEDVDVATRATSRREMDGIMAHSAYSRRAASATGARPARTPAQRKGASSHATHSL